MTFAPSVAVLRTQSDARLVELIRGGSEAAFAALTERYRGILRRACARVIAPARVDDVLQEALVAAWRAIRRGDDVHDVRAWLLRIARNTALNALRTPGYDHDELIDSLRCDEAPHTVLERRETILATLAGVAALPEHQRVALLRNAVEGVSQRQIAADLGVSEGAVRQLVLRARTAMRSAATAVIPLPIVERVAQTGQRGAPSAARAAEIAAGAAPVGAIAVTKLSAAAVVAGMLAVGPAIVAVPADGPRRGATTAAPADLPGNEIRARDPSSSSAAQAQPGAEGASDQSPVREASPPDRRATPGRRRDPAERGAGHSTGGSGRWVDGDDGEDERGALPSTDDDVGAEQERGDIEPDEDVDAPTEDVDDVDRDVESDATGSDDDPPEEPSPPAADSELADEPSDSTSSSSADGSDDEGGASDAGGASIPSGGEAP